MLQEEIPPGTQENSWKGRVFMKRLLVCCTALSIFLLAGCVNNISTGKAQWIPINPSANLSEKTYP